MLNNRCDASLVKFKGLLLVAGPQPLLLLLFLLVFVWLIKTGLTAPTEPTNRPSSTATSYDNSSSTTDHLGVVEFSLPDQVPANYVIGNIPRKLTHFPFQPSSRQSQDNGDDGTVMTALAADPSGLAVRLVQLTDLGDLVTLQSIDRDDRDALCGPLSCCRAMLCSLNFDALFMHPKWKLVRVKVKLSINDANDNSPVFSQPTFSLWVSEDDGRSKQSDPSRSFALPTARDADADPNGIVLYRLRANPWAMSRFELQVDLGADKVELRVIDGQPFDFDTLDEQTFKLVVEAVDGGSPERIGSLLVIIHLVDLNDNAPKFVSPLNQDGMLQVYVSENKTYQQAIVNVKAIDEDSGDNGFVRYAFGPSFFKLPARLRKKFHINSSTGSLSLIDRLDYERYDERLVEISLIAFDAGDPPLSSTIRVRINVKDINDNQCHLIVQENRSISENQPANQLALRLVIRDADDVSRDKIDCRSDIDPGIPLKLEPASVDQHHLRVVSTAPLDYEQVQQLHFGLVCVDKSEPRQVTRFNLTISVKDENDNAPLFEPTNVYNISVDETMPVTEHLLTITAFDPDVSDGPCLRYHFVEPNLFYQGNPSKSSWSHYNQRLNYVNSQFKIDSITGNVYLQNQLDYEKVKQIVTGLQVTDSCERVEQAGHTTYALLIVNVRDVNDSPPLLTSPDVVDVKENIPIGSQVQTLHFQDADSGLGGEWSISSYDTRSSTITKPLIGQLFKVTPDGHVLTIGEIDREETPQILLRVIVTDRDPINQLSSTVTITFNVADDNDNKPQLIKPKPGSTINYAPVLIEHEQDTSFYELSSYDRIDPVILSFEEGIRQLSRHRKEQQQSNFVLIQAICRLESSDLDMGPNGQVSYFTNTSCNASSLFHLDDREGVVRSRLRLSIPSGASVNKLDDFDLYPEPGTYKLCLELVDHGVDFSLRSSTHFFIHVGNPIPKSVSQALWPSDSAVGSNMDNDPLSMLGLTTDNRNGHLLTSTADNLHQGVVGKSGSGGSRLTNIVISLLILAFALTLIVASIGAICWARSKHVAMTCRTSVNSIAERRRSRDAIVPKTVIDDAQTRVAIDIETTQVGATVAKLPIVTSVIHPSSAGLELIPVHHNQQSTPHLMIDQSPIIFLSCCDPTKSQAPAYLLDSMVPSSEIFVQNSPTFQLELNANKPSEKER